MTSSRPRSHSHALGVGAPGAAGGAPAPLSARASYFDSIAERWDGWEDLPALAAKLGIMLAEAGIAADETVLDVGCGTGNLTRVLLGKLGAAGRVVAVDVSSRMVEIARRKIDDARARWLVADAARLPLDDGSMSRIVCYSVWPHFEDHGAVAAELWRVLAPGGSLHVWHLMGRERINGIHSGAGHAIRHDVLAPAGEIAKLLAGAGFQLIRTLDDEARVLVDASKVA